MIKEQTTPQPELPPHGKFKIEKILDDMEKDGESELTKFTYQEREFSVVLTQIAEKKTIRFDDINDSFDLYGDKQEESDDQEKERDFRISTQIRDAETNTPLGLINGLITVKNDQIEATVHRVDFVSQSIKNFAYDNPKVEYVHGLIRNTFLSLVVRGTGIIDTWYSSREEGQSAGGRGLYAKIMEAANSDETPEDSLEKQVNIVKEEESFDGGTRYKMTPKK